jgi:biopolymer transport protein ExbD
MKRREPLSFDLTPLIDVVFILLIFFLVTSAFKEDKFALSLTLPDAQAQKTEIEKKQLSIELNQKGLAFNGKKTDYLTLQKELEKITDKQKSVIVNIDKSVPYEKVVELLDILQLNNLNNLSLVTIQK